MKIKIFQLILLLSLIAPTTQAQIISQKVVKGKKNEYTLTTFQSGNIRIDNNQRYFEGSCECALPDGSTMGSAALLDEGEYKRFVAYMSSQLKSTLKAHPGLKKHHDDMDIYCHFDKKGTLREVIFSYDSMYNFPIEKIENIEEFMKNDLIFTPVAEKYRKRMESANYTIMLYLINFADIMK